MNFSADAPSNSSLRRRLVGLFRWGFEQRLLRFLIVGGLNTVFGFGLFTAFYLFSHMRQPSLVAATAVGVLFNYFTTGRLVFANKGAKRLIAFGIGYALVLGLNMALLELLARSGIATLLAQAIALPISVVASYAINRYVIFPETAGPVEPSA